MKIKYLGTAAYEGIPAIFCQCELCKKAGVLGGKDIRTRASMLINDDTLIDFGPDIYMHKLNYNLDLGKIKYIMETHSHSDHLSPFDLMARAESVYTHLDEKHTGTQIKVYGNDAVKAMIDGAIEEEFSGKQNFMEYILVKPTQTHQAGNLKITALLAKHKVGEECLIYLIEQDGKTVLYGNDTGIFPEETFEYLAGKKLDIVSLDCTGGAIHADGHNHMGMESNVKVKQRLEELGCAQEGTRWILTHFSHNCKMTHEELTQQAEAIGFEIAYDGLEIEIEA
ncbi:MAG: MBL fold metallo-hydrolase [Cellulosilyticaceae bacterium]